MNPNFDNSFHQKDDIIQKFPQSEQCLSNHKNFSLDNDIMRTYSLDTPKVNFENWNTQTQTKVIKQECNLDNPFIQNQNVESEFQINVDNILQINQNCIKFI
ncbi:unnamed protein product [Paramecium primaurelia]|uniref:Uncharacterized protein n=1 Tax=Paramecium primaurelia TaxID=5886 RepID=A0A8S1MI55_PARPR|nr:unnamed protein product [Paramecium primaurelia]